MCTSSEHHDLCNALEPAPEDANAAGTASSGTSRRRLLTGALVAGGAAVAASVLGQVTLSQARATTNTPITGDGIVPLGLDGGPRLNVDVPAPLAGAKPALALLVNGRTYLVDCGYDTARQLLRAGLAFGDVHDVFVTHHHFDHTSGLPGFVLHGWTINPKPLTDVRFWGPPSMSRQVNGIRTSFAEEVDLFSAGGGFPPFPTLAATEVTIPPGNRIQRVMEDDNVVVDAVHVFHGPEVRNAYAYRFTVKSTGKVVVFSGDTAAPDANLIALAQGADVLVHETQDNDNVLRIASQIPDPVQREQLIRHLFEAHSDVRALPGVAKAAGAKKLVFSHYTPFPQPPAVYLGKAQAAAADIDYTGTIVAPAELDFIAL